MTVSARSWVILVLAFFAAVRGLAAEPPPPDRRLTLAGQVSGTLAPDDPGFFNFNDYEHSLRRLRLSLAAQFRASDHVAVLGEVISENVDEPRPYALYVRVRPWSARSFDVQAGRIPSVFGAYARRRYGTDNPLIGEPLAYQYLTSLRADAMPATADELLRQRGEGWLVGYSIGAAGRAPGLPLVNAQRWDTGVQVRVGADALQATAALTQGTLSRPRVRDDNGGKQLSGRLAWQPLTGLIVGASAARGEFVTRELRRSLRPTGDRGYFQRAWGIDVEYSHGYGLVRAEVLWSAWDVPVVDVPFLESPLRAMAFTGEGRWKLVPGLYLAARFDRLDFSHVTGSSGRITWDAPVTRIEAGLGYSLRRDLLLKAAWQRNRRDGGEVRDKDLAALQLAFTF